MGTRIAQFDALLSGYVDPNTGLVGAGYTVYFYAAGTTTAKDVWTAYDKTGGAVQSVVLDATGSALVFGDGVYKLVIKNLSAATVDTFDGVKVQWPALNVVTTTAATLTLTTDDDVALCDPTSTNQTITMPLAATCDHPITIKRIAGGANTLTIAAAGSDTLDGAATYSISTLNSDVTWISDGATWYGKAVATTNANTLAGYSPDTASTPATIPVRDGSGELTGIKQATTSLVGGIEVATSAEVITGTDTERAVTPAGIVDLFDDTGRRVLTADGGYQKLPGGLIVQWGLAGSSSVGNGATNNVAVTFPIAFPTSSIIVVPAIVDGLGAISILAGANGSTGVTLSYSNQSGSTRTIQARWYAVGY